MLKPDNAASVEEREGARSGSILDLLYSDHRRVASFLSQFDDFGHLQQITATESVEKSRSSEVQGTVGSNHLVGLKTHKQSVRVGGESSERVYDPLWSNALNLLDTLAANRMISNSPATCGIGGFILWEGELAIADLAIIKRAWSLDTFKKIMKPTPSSQVGNRHDRRKAAKKQEPPDSDSFEFGLAILDMLPHTVQAAIATPDYVIWCNLDAANMAVSTGDLFVKHGISIPGRWHILGVLDAKPDDSSLEPHPTIERTVGGVLVSNVMGELAPAARLLIGRPSSAYAVTPILIFRKISAAPA